jgi:hypothetical protein
MISSFIHSISKLSDFAVFPNSYIEQLTTAFPITGEDYRSLSFSAKKNNKKQTSFESEPMKLHEDN